MDDAPHGLGSGLAALPARQLSARTSLAAVADCTHLKNTLGLFHSRQDHPPGLSGNENELPVS